MPTWLELDKQFSELADDMQFRWLAYNWGAAGTHYRLAGGGSSDTTRRFEALARVAGMKLQELPPGTLHADVMRQPGHAERWYEALKQHSGAFQDSGRVARQLADDGTFMGHLFSGTLENPAAASGVLALSLSGVPATAPEPSRGMWSRLNRWLAREHKERGRVWAVAGAVLGLVLAALGLLAAL